MNHLLQWLAMGRYSIYVWPAYGIVCTFIVMNILGLRIKKARTMKKLTEWFKR